MIRQFLYELVKGSKGFDELCQSATDDNGPFSDHLLRHLSNVKDQKTLANTFKLLINKGGEEDTDSIIRLLKAGLIQKTKDGYKPRCELYAQYFGKKLA